MNKDNVLKFLIPLVAVVVILESVIIVSGIAKNRTNGTGDKVSVNVSENIGETVSPKDSVADLVFSIDNKSMSVGKKYKLSLNAFPKQNFDVDGMDFYIKYDPSAFDVSNLLAGDSELGKPAASKISKEKGMIVVNYWISDPEGYSFNNGKLANMLTVDLVAKKEGDFSFEIATGQDDSNSVTMLVEKATAKVLPFASNQLNVKVAK